MWLNAWMALPISSSRPGSTRAFRSPAGQLRQSGGQLLNRLR